MSQELTNAAKIEQVGTMLDVACRLALITAARVFTPEELKAVLEEIRIDLMAQPHATETSAAVIDALIGAGVRFCAEFHK